MEPLEDGDGFRLSTGRTFYAYGCRLSLGHEDFPQCEYGSDGTIWESYTYKRGSSRTPEEFFTAAERTEIADYMIALWTKFKETGR
jgi:hypothetical protein